MIGASYKYILGIAVTTVETTGGPSADLVTNKQLMDYSFITTPFTLASDMTLLRCSSGLVPPGGDGNTDLGGWFFENTMVSLRPVTRPPTAACLSPEFEVAAANGRRFPGVVNLVHCEPFTTTEEGVYSCIMMNSSMMDQTMRVGVYFGGRSESIDCN